MPLIKCIDCGYEVSTFAEQCPQCGCPVHISISEHNKSKLYDIEVENIPENASLSIGGFICQINNVGFDKACDIMRSVPFIIVSGVNFDTASELNEIMKKEGCKCQIVDSAETEEKFTDQDLKKHKLYQKYQPLKCPRCGSTVVTTTSRGYSLVWGFAGSNKTVNRCGKCGYTWKP